MKTISLSSSEKKMIQALHLDLCTLDWVSVKRCISGPLNSCHSSWSVFLKNITLQLQAYKSPLTSSGCFKLLQIIAWNSADFLPPGVHWDAVGVCRAALLLALLNCTDFPWSTGKRHADNPGSCYQVVQGLRVQAVKFVHMWTRSSLCSCAYLCIHVAGIQNSYWGMKVWL